MNDTQAAEKKRRSRLRWLTLGEAVAVSALIVSGLGLWNSWRSGNDEPTRVVEERTAVPLSLRGQSEEDGEELILVPVEESHALDSLTVQIRGEPIHVGSEGRLSAADIESALGDAAESGKGTHRVRVEISARYVEGGRDRRSNGSYVISYDWDDGGLLGGRSLRLTGIARA